MKASLAELRVMVALAESGHFTRAAERLGMSQSSLSAALVKLEKQLGIKVNALAYPFGIYSPKARGWLRWC